jgi:hypothetical protein
LLASSLQDKQCREVSRKIFQAPRNVTRHSSSDGYFLIDGRELKFQQATHDGLSVMENQEVLPVVPLRLHHRISNSLEHYLHHIDVVVKIFVGVSDDIVHAKVHSL